MSFFSNPSISRLCSGIAVVSAFSSSEYNHLANPGTGESDEAYLFDAGTEEDEAVGFGIYQAPRQAGPNQGPADDNTTIRRQASITDVQFGKGTINSAPGVVYLQDPRGGYNLVRVDIQPQ